MGDPTVLFCVGATKAGTSWLYRYLHDHPECTLPAVKEAHYWDTADPADAARQVAAFQGRVTVMQRRQADARALGRDRQARNLQRQIVQLTELMAVLQGDRTDHAAYLGWLFGPADARAGLVADLTPSYGLLPAARIKEMLSLSPASRFVYLIRDPLDRLWSHVRMQAARNATAGEDVAKRAHAILSRVLDERETHIMARGDYATTIARLRDAVPQGQLLVEFTERLFTPEGLRRMTDFLEISYVPAAQNKVHEGDHVALNADFRAPMVALLKEQYDWVARMMGPLPQNWQDNQARAVA